MRREIKVGSTSQFLPIRINDTSSSVGAGLSSLVFNTSGLTAKYRKEGQSSWTTITLVTATLGTWSSGGFILDSSGVNGDYELGIPNAAISSGTWVRIVLYGAANMQDVEIEVTLVAIDKQDTVRLGLTSIPNVAQGNAGQLATADANARIDLGKWLGVAPLALTAQQIQAVVPVTQKVDLNTWLTLTPLGLIAQQVQSIVPDTQKVDVNTLKTQVLTATSPITFRANVGTAGVDTAQSVDVWNSIGTGGINLTTLGDTRLNHLDADVSSRNAVAPPSVSDIVDGILDEPDGVEGGYTLREALMLILASCAGKVSGGRTALVKVRDVNDTKDRITATVDPLTGDRLSLTLNVTP